jgi:hypothetical protein
MLISSLKLVKLERVDCFSLIFYFYFCLLKQEKKRKRTLTKDCNRKEEKVNGHSMVNVFLFTMLNLKVKKML